MFGIIWFVIGVICSIWAYEDACERESAGCLVFLLVLFLGPIGLIIWLIIRPKKE